jgi:hypothetical protein
LVTSKGSGIQISPFCRSGTTIWTASLTPMQSVLPWFSLCKVPLVIFPAPKQALQLVQPGVQCDYLINAIFGEVWAVQAPLGVSISV